MENISELFSKATDITLSWENFLDIQKKAFTLVCWEDKGVEVIESSRFLIPIVDISEVTQKAQAQENLSPAFLQALSRCKLNAESGAKALRRACQHYLEDQSVIIVNTKNVSTMTDHFTILKKDTLVEIASFSIRW